MLSRTLFRLETRVNWGWVVQLGTKVVSILENR